MHHISSEMSIEFFECLCLQQLTLEQNFQDKIWQLLKSLHH